MYRTMTNNIKLTIGAHKKIEIQITTYKLEYYFSLAILYLLI